MEIEIIFCFFIGMIRAVNSDLKAMFVHSTIDRKMQLPFGVVLLPDVLLLISV